MARDFSARTDIDNTNPGDFPDGRILDSNPASANNGTAVNEAVYGDLYQFFLKLLRDASIIPNGNADTDSTNQLLDALKQLAVFADSTSLGLAVKIVDLPTWDMNTVFSQQVPHGITNGADVIRMAFVNIRSDPGVGRTGRNVYDRVDLGTADVFQRVNWNNTDVVISTDPGSIFRVNTSFNDTTEIRGWITILYAI